MEFIRQYWLEVLFTTVISGVTLAVKSLFKQIKKDKKEREEKSQAESAEQTLIKEGVLAILHDRLYQACQYHIAQKWCSVEDMRNIEYLYKGYHALGGNGTCTELFNRVCKLSIHPYCNDTRKEV